MQHLIGITRTMDHLPAADGTAARHAAGRTPGWTGAGWRQPAARGATLLVSSHVLSEVERICDQVVILHEGRIAAAGALDAVVAPGESLEDAFVRAVRA